MKTLNFVAAIVFALTVVAVSQAQAQPNEATGTAIATATVVTPITIDKTADLNFAEVVASSTAGTVDMSFAGVRTAFNGATLGNGSGASAAAFVVSGDPSATYAITLPGSILLVSGSDNMTVDNFASNPNGTGALDSSGQQTLDVGATLHVDANQPMGTYNGSFAVTVAYN